MVKKNIIWIVVDSVRNYHTDVDDRGRIDIIDELANVGVEFKTAVTSAPSTVMSTSAMMTGIPSIYHSRSYRDFDFNDCGIKSLPSILEKNGYNVYSVIFFPEGRRFLKPMMRNICENCWPNHANPKEFWSNDIVNEILKNLINQGINEPFFLFINYNCRYDPKTSEKVKLGIDRLRSSKLLDNALLIINSDHGYPDPSREISFYDKRKLGHDLILTDDNILVPLVIQFPEKLYKTVDFPVSLLDIMPTILEYIGKDELYDTTSFLLRGKSLLPIILEDKKSENELFRTDNRYIFQDFRKTALRTRKYKYIYNFENQTEEFYNLESDYLEGMNLIGNDKYKKILEHFREILYEQEQKIYNYHKKIIKGKVIQLLNEDDQIIAILGNPSKIFINILIEIFTEISKNVLYQITKKNKNGTFVNLLSTQDKEFVSEDELSKIDLALGIFVNENPKENYTIRKISKQINTKRIVYVNYNLKIKNEPSHWLVPSLKKFISLKLPLLKDNPKTFIIDTIILLKNNIFRTKRV